MKYQLAQLNIADAKADAESETMQGFYNRIDEIHELAENAKGYVWRYQDEEDDIAERVFGNPLMLINLTVWEDIETLREFVYRTAHKELIKGKADWFHKMSEMHQVLWWIPIGHIPSVEESYEKLTLLRTQGPTPKAFSFSKPFYPENESK